MRRLFVPVVQQSAPALSGAAALASVCRGFGITAEENDVSMKCDGSEHGICIDSLEAEARRRGLACDQLLVPTDHVLLDGELLPSIAVVRANDHLLGGVVLWRQFGRLVQVMDPGRGRRWIKTATVAAQLYRHSQAVPRRQLGDWLQSPSFERPLERRIRGLRIPDAHTLIANACCEPGWKGIAALDAAVRQVSTERKGWSTSGAINRDRVLMHWKSALERPETIPHQYWFVTRENAFSDDDQPHVVVRGAVILRFFPPRH
jgi:ATP-binding cassette subfamily B protein